MSRPAPVTALGRGLSPDELRAVVAGYAAEVRSGALRATFDREQRWHVRLHQDDDVDVWLISWTREQGTELHDHGGSSGAFTVVEGTLAEYVWTGTRDHVSGPVSGRLVPRSRGEGETIAFGADYVHDVRNHHDRPAISVHAYSPPIRLMNYYDATEGGLLRWASTWTDDPETPGPERRAS